MSLVSECYDGICLDEIDEIPRWVKEDIVSWSQKGSVDYIVNGIKYMLDNGIIKAPQNSDPLSEQNIPDWLKKNATWWSGGQITDDDFKNAIEFLVLEGIIRV